MTGDIDDFATAGALVTALADREISSVELVEHAIARIETLDGTINAVVVRDFDRARDAAAEADAALARGERRPLLGLPMTVKDSFNVAGLPTSWGNPEHRDFVAREDAIAVQRLKQAGAVVLGKTNVPLDLGDWQAYNAIHGTTNNPWDVTRTPGGSSGGSAAALAAGFISLEMGSDLAGSLRAPAHFCGVCSHKPSIGLVPSRGQTPPGLEPSFGEPDLAVIGPMARSADDLGRALDVIAGPDILQARAFRLELPPARHAQLADFRILVLTEHPLLPTSAAIAGPIDRLAERLAAAGAKVARSTELLPDLTTMTRSFVQLLLGFFGANMPEPAYQAIAAEIAKAPASRGDPALWRSCDLVASHRDWVRADRIRVGLRKRWLAFFEEWDAILVPPMPIAAFPHDHDPDRQARRVYIDGTPHPVTELMYWPSIATVGGLPATTIPLERTEDGLPTGVQIIGPAFEDRTPIALGSLIERAFGGFVPPSLTFS